MLSRRRFLGQVSATTAYAWANTAHAEKLLSLASALQSPPSPGAETALWKSYGRIVLQHLQDSIVIQDGFTMEQRQYGDCEFSFEARAPQGTPEVQIWSGIKCRDRDSRYVFAIRGGNNDHLYLARYGPDGTATFLGIAPLDFHPVPGDWYTLRAVTRGKRILLFLNQEQTPRINVADDDAHWAEGAVSLGGGWLPAEFRNVKTNGLSTSDASAIDALGDAVWMAPKPDKAQLREQQRKAYLPAEVAAFDQPRATHPLDGNWLFLPDHELASSVTPQSEVLSDDQWHVMDVPNFWTPTLSWLHDETGFPKLKGISSSKGICDKLWEAEIRRLEGYTFDWTATKGGWYRHYLNLPAGIANRRFELCFDAIAKVADVWVNGTHVGSHVGMFGEVRCDISHAIKPGKNLLAVHVVGHFAGQSNKNEVLGVAVTVEVTSEMLTSLPHGMYPNDASGIWQPVTLLVTNEVSVQDVYTKPRLNGLDFEVTLLNAAARNQDVSISYTITPSTGGPEIYSAQHAASQSIGATPAVLHLTTPNLSPKPWSPHEPNLYVLEVTLTSGNAVLDKHKTTFGFRTFQTDKGRLMLNGRPFWLRGANHFPNALRPNDGELAKHFMQLAKAGNIVATRSHTVPFTTRWLEAADEAGMAVSYEGSWPWLMLEGDVPSKELLTAWKDEFLSLIRKHRNHPSLLLWTVNNEMKFEVLGRSNPVLLREKWEVLSDMVRSMRKADPTRPIVCDSSYCRQEIGSEYQNLVRPSDFDDGDIDDAHRYYGWYDPSFFHLFRGEFGKKAAYPTRPLISQEMSTGYPRNDDGHPTRFYLFQHHTPQSLVGPEAYENRDPALFLERQSFMTKELAEAIRRTNRQECSGVLHFAYISWFKNVWNTQTIEPLPTYHSLSDALQPVLVSAELFGRHFYAGSKTSLRVCIANDSESGKELPEGRLIWQVKGGGKVLASGALATSVVAYYTNVWSELVLSLPAELPSPRVDATLNLLLELNGIVHSKNSYDITIGTHDWATQGLQHPVAIFTGKNNAQLTSLPIAGREIVSLQDAKPEEVVIVPNAESVLGNSKVNSELRQFVGSGGRVLLLHAGAKLASLFPDQVKSYRACPGEIVSMHIPESPAFDGLEPLDLAWFELGGGSLPRACRGVYKVEARRADTDMLAEVVDIHGYLKTPADLAKYDGSPLVQLSDGKGKVIASEMMLFEAPQDPVAGRLLANLVKALGSASQPS
jgi:Glycosyl hydrolases family 2/Glycosyl hydrolases family 2, TIM barrel domain/Glycosyl hydrolases family 2, sugar binding domain